MPSSLPVPTHDDDDQPWLRQPGESNVWYDRFSRFLKLGAARSVRAVYNAEKNNVGPSKPVPAAWTEKTKLYEWRKRAEAYDAWRRAEVFTAGNAQDTERVRKLDELAEAMHKKLMAELAVMEMTDRFIERYLGVMDMLAKHTGGYAPQRVEHTGKDGKAIEVEQDTTMRVVFYVPEVDPIENTEGVEGDGQH